MKNLICFQNLDVELKKQGCLQHHLPNESHNRNQIKKPTFSHQPELWSHQTSSIALLLPCHALQSRQHRPQHLTLISAIPCRRPPRHLLLPWQFLVHSLCFIRLQQQPPGCAQKPAENSVIVCFYRGGGFPVLFSTNMSPDDEWCPPSQPIPPPTNPNHHYYEPTPPG